MSRVLIDGHPYVPHAPPRVPLDQARARGSALFAELDARRSVRHFSDAPVPKDLIAQAIVTAGTAPSGAHQQPWTWVAISDADVKARIRVAAEREEHRSYEGGRMSDEWKQALAPLGTDWRKPYLETVPWLVVLFAQRYGLDDQGVRRKHYYVTESVGMAAGLFIASLHRMGLCTLTHTPSPMGFLAELLGRPPNETAMVLFPVGYAAEGAVVPDLRRKSLEESCVWVEGD